MNTTVNVTRNLRMYRGMMLNTYEATFLEVLAQIKFKFRKDIKKKKSIDLGDGLVFENYDKQCINDSCYRIQFNGTQIGTFQADLSEVFIAEVNATVEAINFLTSKLS